MFPASITLEELVFKQDFNGVELDNCNDIKMRIEVMILYKIDGGYDEEEAMVEVKACFN